MSPPPFLTDLAPRQPAATLLVSTPCSVPLTTIHRPHGLGEWTVCATSRFMVRRLQVHCRCSVRCSDHCQCFSQQSTMDATGISLNPIDAARRPSIYHRSRQDLQVEEIFDLALCGNSVHWWFCQGYSRFRFLTSVNVQPRVQKCSRSAKTCHFEV